MRLNKNKIESLIIGAIGCLVVTNIIQPLLVLLANLLINVGNKVFPKIINSIYIDIASGSTNYSFIIFSLLLVLVMAVLIYRVHFLYDKLRESIKNLKEAMLGKKEPTNEEIEESKRKAENILKTSGKILKTDKIISIILLSIIIINIIYIISIGYYKDQEISKFSQVIKILHPYITEQEKNILESNFSSMSSYQDYKNLYDKIALICKDNNIIMKFNY